MLSQKGNLPDTRYFACGQGHQTIRSFPSKTLPSLLPKQVSWGSER